MVAVVVEHVILSTCPIFGQLLQYFNKFLGFHSGLAKINFSIELVLSAFRLYQDDSALIGIGRNDTVTVLLVTGCIYKSFT